MPYVSKTLLGRALEALAGQHPLLLFSIPAMARENVPSVASQAAADANPVRFGGAQEKQLLDAYFRVPGVAPEQPYFSPSAGALVAARYAETSLQRQRKDKARPTPNRLFFETGGRGDRGYAWQANIATLIPQDDSLLPNGPVSLLALAAWMYRDQEIEGSAQSLIDQVKEDLGIDRDGLIGPVYDDSPFSVDVSSGFEDAPISPEALRDLLKAPPPPPPPPSLGTVDELVSRIEEAMEQSGVALGTGLVARVVRAWLNRDVAVLVGAPGTGKSTFAREFAAACEIKVPEQRETVEVLIDPEFDASRMFGYLDLGGAFQASPFTTRVLRTGSPLLPRVVILEEWNTAQVETYLSQVLHAVEGDGAVQLADGTEPRLPIDTLLIATCNSVRDEPETRLPISRPTKRRTTIIEMPNILFDAWEDSGTDGVAAQLDMYLGYERERLSLREDSPPAFDELRAAGLESVGSVSDLHEGTREVLFDLIDFIFSSPEGRDFLTVGLLVDILQDIIFAGDDAAAALGWQVTGKILEQVTDVTIARGIAERCASLPNADAISRAVDRMDLHDGGVAPLL